MCLINRITASNKISRAQDDQWLTRLAIVPLVSAATTASWGAVRIGPAPLSDALLLVAFALVLFDIITGVNRAKLPGYVYLAALSVGVVALVNSIQPADAQYLANRLQLTGFAGRALAQIDTGAFNKALFWLVAIVVVPFVTLACMNSARKTCGLVMGGVVIGTAISSAVAISDFLGLSRIGPSLNGYANESSRQFGLTVHSNNLGVSCAIAVPIALYLLTQRKFGLVGAACLPLLAGGVLLSGSRGAQVVFVLAAICGAILAARKAPLRFIFWAGAFLLLVLIMWATFNQFIPPEVSKQLLRFGGDSAGSSSSDDGRVTLAKQAVSDFWHNPFVGIGIPYITYAHSIYLQLLSAGGIVLTTAFLCYFFCILRDGLNHGRNIGPVRYLTVSVASWLLVGVVENQLTDRFLYYTGACLIAYAYSTAENRVKPLEHNKPFVTSEPRS